MEHVFLPEDACFLHFNQPKVFPLFKFLLEIEEGLSETMVSRWVVKLTNCHSKAERLAGWQTVVLESNMDIIGCDSQVLDYCGK